jgi:CDP-diacylglycerol--glycerol-3-phosphate 3-phosphatidyltransferase
MGLGWGTPAGRAQRRGIRLSEQLLPDDPGRLREDCAPGGKDALRTGSPRTASPSWHEGLDRGRVDVYPMGRCGGGSSRIVLSTGRHAGRRHGRERGGGHKIRSCSTQPATGSATARSSAGCLVGRVRRATTPRGGGTLICLVTSHVISYIKARARPAGFARGRGFIEPSERLFDRVDGAGLYGLFDLRCCWRWRCGVWGGLHGCRWRRRASRARTSPARGQDAHRPTPRRRVSVSSRRPDCRAGGIPPPFGGGTAVGSRVRRGLAGGRRMTEFAPATCSTPARCTRARRRPAQLRKNLSRVSGCRRPR